MTSYPKPPSRIGKITKRKDIRGDPMTYTVLDEIVHVPESNRAKALYLQLLKFEDGREELRFCYYMIGHRPRGKGKWLFGQFAPMIGRQDLESMLSEARKRGWIV